MLAKQVLSGPDSGCISETHRVYKTDNKMFLTNIDLAIESKLSLMQVSIKKYTSDDMMRVVHDDGRELQLDKQKVQDGLKNFYLSMNQSLHLEYPSNNNDPQAKLSG